MRQIKRKISTFLKSEKASVSRKGLLTAAVSAGLVFVLSQNAAACSWYSVTTHSNTVAAPWRTTTFNTQHYNHSNHAQHCSY